MDKTEKNLMDAFAGESQANRKYLAFSKKAQDDGLAQIGRLFRAVAAAETIHAHSHLKTAGGVKSTVENIKEAISGEHYEFTSMYPEMIEDAKEEGNKGAERSFNFANEVEKIHANLFSKTLESLKNKEQETVKDYYVCNVCGYTVENKAPKKCPICGAPVEQFEKIS